MNSTPNYFDPPRNEQRARRTFEDVVWQRVIGLLEVMYVRSLNRRSTSENRETYASKNVSEVSFRFRGGFIPEIVDANFVSLLS